MMIKRTIRMAACIAISAVLFCGCSCQNNQMFDKKLKDDEVVSISDNTYSKPQAMLLLLTEKTIYSNSYGEEIWSKKMGDKSAEDYVKETVKSQLIQLNAMYQMAKEKDISLTDTEKEKIKENAQSYYDSLSKEDIDELGIVLSDITNMYTQYAMSKKLVENVTKDVDIEISDTAARVMKIQYIHFSNQKEDKNKELTDRSEKEMKECRETLESIQNAVKEDGKDFSTLARKYSEDDVVEMELTQSDMSAEFVEAAFALEKDKMSDILELEDGDYLIYCVEDYLVEKTEKNKEKMQEERLREAFEKEYQTFYEKQNVLFNDSLWEEIHLSEMSDLSVTTFYTAYVEEEEQH